MVKHLKRHVGFFFFEVNLRRCIRETQQQLIISLNFSSNITQVRAVWQKSKQTNFWSCVCSACVFLFVLCSVLFF